MELDRGRQPSLIAPSEITDTVIQVLVQRRLDIFHLPLGGNQGEVPFHDEEAVTQGRGRPPDSQAAKQIIEVLRLVEVIVMLQHRQQQALAEAAWADEEQLPSRCLKSGQTISAVLIPVSLPHQGAEIAEAIGKFHRRPSNWKRDDGKDSRTPCHSLLRLA